MKTAVILMNIGTPDSLKRKDVRRYLSQFLDDPHVINISWLWRKILVKLIIVPFRTRHSAALYQKLWTEEGSPLRYYSMCLRESLQKLYDGQTDIYIAMNYGYPNVSAVMQEIREKEYIQLIVLPLFPHYAMSTTGSAIDAVAKNMAKWAVKPTIKIIDRFFNHPAFLDAWVDRIMPYDPKRFDHVVFSFHGLPLSHIPKECRMKQGNSENHNCLEKQPCYQASCYVTARSLADRLGLSHQQYTASFQSHMGKHWLRPFTDQALKDLAHRGVSTILVIAPSFVADCLETTIELGDEYKELFLSNGGREYVWVESLNDSPKWTHALKEIIDCQ